MNLSWGDRVTVFPFAASPGLLGGSFLPGLLGRSTFRDPDVSLQLCRGAQEVGNPCLASLHMLFGGVHLNLEKGGCKLNQAVCDMPRAFKRSEMESAVWVPLPCSFFLSLLLF